MSDGMISYDKSPIPPEKPGGFASERNPDRGIDVDDKGRMTYESAAAEGMVEVMVPSLPGSPRSTETFHAKDFGQHVIGKIEASMNRQGYMKTGPMQSASEVFRHYVSVMKGAHLADAATIGRAEQLASDFEKEPEREEFYKQVVKPYLGSLTPGRRK